MNNSEYKSSYLSTCDNFVYLISLLMDHILSPVTAGQINNRKEWYQI